MKTICYLADGSSPHTIKWCDYFKKKGYNIHVLSLNGGKIDGVTVHNFDANVVEQRNKGLLQKVGRLKFISEMKQLLKEINPDLLHAQYASSYGFLGTLLNKHPYAISVWGTDIYEFPNNGVIQKQIIKHNFRKADYIFTNSRAMAREVNKYTDKNVDVTFFGVDMERFKPVNIEKDDTFVVGIIKSLEKRYGIEYLIKAFRILKDEYPNKKMILKIGGSGQNLDNLVNLVKELKLENDVEFLGRIASDKIAKTFCSFDVTVFPSLREGFGVAAIESQACEIPVIVTNVGGHPESLDNNKTGFIVEPESPEQIKEKIAVLMNDEELRIRMGKQGRKFVRDNYEVNHNFREIEEMYNKILNK